MELYISIVSHARVCGGGRGEVRATVLWNLIPEKPIAQS